MANVVTNASNMIDPEVLGQFIEAELPKKIKLTSIATVDSTLVGQPGSTVTIPKWVYVGDAEDVNEGVSLEAVVLDTDDSFVTVKKAGKAIDITDEAVLSGAGDPVGQAGKQIAMAIGAKVDNDVAAALETATLTHAVTVALDKTVVANAKKKVGDKMDELNVMIVHPDKYADLLAQADFTDASKYSGNTLFTGEIGQILGLRVITCSKLTITEVAEVPADGEIPAVPAYDLYTSIIMNSGCVTIYQKRNVVLETARDIKSKVTTLVGDSHYAVGLNDETKIVKITSK